MESSSSRATVLGPSTPFDPELASTKLYESMRGLGTDEYVIAEIIGTHTNEQRQGIKDKYKTMYGKELSAELESELGGSFAKVVLALMKTPEEYLVECVNRAIEGLGTDEHTLIGLLCVRNSNEELERIKTVYEEKYGTPMESSVSSDLSGDLRSLFIGLINGGRDEGDENDVDEEKVQGDAKNLLSASTGLGTSEEIFQSIFLTRSYPHMRSVFDAFKELSGGKEIEEVIKDEFSGGMREAYLALANIFRNRPGFLAQRIHECIKGGGTDDEGLIQLVVGRSEIDLQDVIEAYEEKYERNMIEDIEEDTSGDYGRILRRLLRGVEEEEAKEEEEEAPQEEEEEQ